MALDNYLREVDAEVRAIASERFGIEIVDTKTVPNFDDSYITFPNVEDGVQRCKRIETCVLYVDIRNSSAISARTEPKKLARMYSVFVRSMLSAATYYGGYVRNIIGDRVMVLFDADNCYRDAVDTAVLMNSLAAFVINRHLKGVHFKCGIGIDYGQMLITKAGSAKRGSEREFYRSLVWLGKPANVASKLTDLANKKETRTDPQICEGYYYPLIDKWTWVNVEPLEFTRRLEKTYTRVLRHTRDYFCSFFETTKTTSRTWPPILMTETVYRGYAATRPVPGSVTNGWWTRQAVSAPGLRGAVYGGDVVLAAAEAIT